MVAPAGPAAPTRDDVLAVLGTVMDPEVPVISIVDLGIVRDVAVGEGVRVTITPTYSGCPAMREIERAIEQTLIEHEMGPVTIRTTYAPAWTTDWLSARGRAALAKYGIAPPGPVEHEDALVPLHRRTRVVACPYCASTHTERTSEFGPTACKAIWVCRDCREPFEEFKPI